MESDLLVLECASVVAGFRALNAMPDVRLVSAEPIGGGQFLILARGLARDLVTFAGAQTEIAEFEVIEALEQSVLDAIFSLAPTELDSALIVAETDSVSAMISIAQTLVSKHHLKPVEIKIRKSGLPGAYGYFTGSADMCAAAASDARRQLNQVSDPMRNAAIEVFDQPTAHVRALFGES